MINRVKRTLPNEAFHLHTDYAVDIGDIVVI